MNLIIIVILSATLGQSKTLQEVKIDDPDINLCLGIYLDSLRILYTEENRPHFILNVDQHIGGKFITIGYAPSIGWFDKNLPNKFSLYKERIAFIYDLSEPVNDYSYNNFKSQFNDAFSKVEVLTMFEQAYHNNIGSYRFEVKNGKINRINEVELFPGRKFNNEGLLYDMDGNLKYQGGEYHVYSLDYPHSFHSDKIDPLDFVIEQSGISDNVFAMYGVTALLTIDRNGKIIKVQVNVKKNGLDKSIITNIEQALLAMPNWHSATVNKKKVCYKLLIGL